MGNVHILSSDIVSKIAAGEVIERPASVIKELVENSLDAHSDSITIHLKGAGRTLIHIKDTGHGIEPDDMEKIFLRHATSKIRKLDDLFAIHSLGFRGEALYSIASISDVTLRSNTQTNDTGWEIHLRAGEKSKLRPANIPSGTEIEIRELFFNTPARRKFLKSDTTELHQILNTFLPYAIGHHQCRFLLTHSQKILFDLRRTDDLLERISQALNLKKEHMIDVKRNFSDESLSLRMVLGDINIQRRRKDLQFLFVNDRPVQSRNISFHINQIYRLILPPEMSPFFVLFLNIPADRIDVNMHPTKREVKIKDENVLCSILRSLCEQTLMTHGQARQFRSTSFSPPDRECKGTSPLNRETVPAAPETHPHEFPEKDNLLPYENLIKSATSQGNPVRETQAAYQAEDLFAQKERNLKSQLSRARFIGSFIRKYLLFETSDSILLVDQHAAQERITFEYFKKQIETGHIEVQSLLSPIVLNLTIQENIRWEEGKDKLEKMGFSTTAWDKETIALHSYPHLIKNPEAAVRSLLAGEDIARCDNETLARRACRQSVMSGDKMTEQQANYQKDQLINCSDPFTCPHGRPTVVELKETFLDRQFLRT